MEDARDTLSRWAAQLIAIVGLNICGWGFLFNLHLIETDKSADEGMHLATLLLPLLAILFWRLLDLRRWSGWGSCALLFRLAAGAYELLQQKGGRSWSSFLTQFWSSFACAFCCAVAGGVLVYLLLWRPRIWRDGF